MVNIAPYICCDYLWHCFSLIQIQKLIDLSLKSALCHRVTHILHTRCSKHFFFNMQNLPLLKTCLQLTVGFFWPRDNVSPLTCVKRPKSMNEAYAELNSLNWTGGWHLEFFPVDRDQKRGGGEKRLDHNSRLKGSRLILSTCLIHSHFRMYSYCTQKTAFSLFFF